MKIDDNLTPKYLYNLGPVYLFGSVLEFWCFCVFVFVLSFSCYRFCVFVLVLGIEKVL